jgi:hypothetical protein
MSVEAAPLGETVAAEWVPPPAGIIKVTLVKWPQTSRSFTFTENLPYGEEDGLFCLCTSKKEVAEGKKGKGSSR